jgi:choline dehydrogenase-like flavoprotein
MIIDGKTIPNGEVIQTDLCIIGGGVTGIGMALQFIHSGLDVCLLEGGDFEPNDRSRELANGDNIGVPYYRLDHARPRYFGGASNLWAGWCRPLDGIDFEKRDWVPYSGWPITKKDLDPYYTKAQHLCEIDDKPFDALDWFRSMPDLYREPYVNDSIQATVWVGSPPTKFGKRYRKALEDASNVRVYLNSNVTELVTDDQGGEITYTRVATLNRNRYEVQAKVFVLLPGAIEAARILLASKQGGRQGLGNEHDVVGRYFMEHPHVVTAKVHLYNRQQSSRAIIPALDHRFIKGAIARLKLERPTDGVKFAYTIREQVQREEKLLNYSAHLRTVSPSRNSDGYRSLKLILANMRSMKSLLRQVKHGSIPDGMGTQIKNLVLNPDDVFRVLYGQLFARPKVLELYSQSEQVPNPESRVMISDQLDELGVPRAVLDWRLSLLDKVSIRESQNVIAELFKTSGVGELVPEPWVVDDDADWDRSLIGGYHHIGTARMGTDPKQSVVDQNCKVHSVSNLYVTSTSAFPTGGYANPLLTGLALTLRTADHIKELFSSNRGIR